MSGVTNAPRVRAAAYMHIGNGHIGRPHRSATSEKNLMEKKASCILPAVGLSPRKTDNAPTRKFSQPGAFKY
eukprot:COSAG06_NODE_137_length_22365_cov_49.346313_18_plen_72_part_00